jgi:hypothetical protein
MFSAQLPMSVVSSPVLFASRMTGGPGAASAGFEHTGWTRHPDGAMLLLVLFGTSAE